MGSHEGCKSLLSNSISRLCCFKEIIGCPSLCMVVPSCAQEKKRIVAKIKSKYWTRTHKFGVKIPKTIAQAKQFDQENGNTLWWDAIVMEMKNVRIAFEEFDGIVVSWDAWSGKKSQKSRVLWTHSL